MTSVLALVLLQAPTGPVVRMYTPAVPAVDMYADGSAVLGRLPASTIPRVPPQDSNDIAVKFALAGCELADLGKTVPAVKAVLDKHKVSCP